MINTQNLVLFLTILSIVYCAFEIQWNMVDNVHNSSVCDSNIRIRKINRSQAGLRGNVTLRTDIGNNYILFNEIFHSPLGNNQFSRTPYKLPVLGMCDFHNFMMKEYRAFLAPVVENLPADNECPIRARIITLKDVVFDSNALPQHLRPGLWKSEMKVVEALTRTNILEVHFYVNVYNYE